MYQGRYLLPDGSWEAWDTWKDPEGNEIRSFTIITTGPNDVMRPIHDRMPVILKREYEAMWLDPDYRDLLKLSKLLEPYSSEAMESYAVNPRVNSAKNEGPELVERSP
jgi:putative SOS response-associated peptidase YedK